MFYVNCQVEPAQYEDFLTVDPPDRQLQDSRAWPSMSQSPQRSQRSGYQQHEVEENEMYSLHSSYQRSRSPPKSRTEHVREETQYMNVNTERSFEERSKSPHRSRSPRKSRRHEYAEQEIDEQPDLTMKRIEVESDEDLR